MADISELHRQLGFLQAGGGRKGIAEEIAGLLAGAGTGLSAAGQGFKGGAEAQSVATKQLLESQKFQQEQTPFFTLTPKSEIERKRAALGKPVLQEDVNAIRNKLSFFDEKMNAGEKLTPQEELEATALVNQLNQMQEQVVPQRVTDADINSIKNRLSFFDAKMNKGLSLNPQEKEEANRILDQLKLFEQQKTRQTELPILEQEEAESERLKSVFGTKAAEAISGVPRGQVQELARASALFGKEPTDFVYQNPQTGEISQFPQEGFVLKIKSETAAKELGKERAQRQREEERSKLLEIRQKFSTQERLARESFARTQTELGQEFRETTATPVIRKQFKDLNNNLQLLEKIEKALSDAIEKGITVTGPVFGRVGAPLGEITGKLTTDQKRLITQLRLNFGDFVRERGGTAFTQTEKEVFSPIVPEMTQREDVNIDRVRTLIEIFKEKELSFKQQFPRIDLAAESGTAPQEKKDKKQEEKPLTKQEINEQADNAIRNGANAAAVNKRRAKLIQEAEE